MRVGQIGKGVIDPGPRAPLEKPPTGSIYLLSVRAYDIIRKKRDGEELTADEIAFIIGPPKDTDIPDYQVSAFLMAVCLRGMSEAETVSLTQALLHSGATVDLTDVRGIKVDKHSTGGVGDKTSIILAPLLAAMGIKVPMMAGRTLGHTGGTIDKLESIPGLRTDIPIEEFKRNLNEVGFSIIAQSDDIVPADKRLYALRDVTATAESIPLIASSIMSKKIAEGADGLVLDVKTGCGALIKDLSDARLLARTMVNIGNSMGVRSMALITDMEQPLGRTVGNSLEIKECISAFRGKGADDLMDVTLTLTAWVLNIADSVSDEVPLKMLDDNAMRRYKHEAMDFLEKGDAFKKFIEFIDAQHGDPEAAFKPGLLPGAVHARHIEAPAEGYIRRLDAFSVGMASVLLGAGRMKTGDAIDHGAGIILNKKTGDYVKAGEPVAMLHANDDGRFKEAVEAFLSGLEIGDRETAKRKLIWEVVV